MKEISMNYGQGIMEAFIEEENLLQVIESNAFKLDKTEDEIISNAINNPIPTLTAVLRQVGIALKIASLTFVRERIMKIIPSANTAVSAVCHE